MNTLWCFTYIRLNKYHIYWSIFISSHICNGSDSFEIFCQKFFKDHRTIIIFPISFKITLQMEIFMGFVDSPFSSMKYL